MPGEECAMEEQNSKTITAFDSLFTTNRTPIPSGKSSCIICIISIISCILLKLHPHAGSCGRKLPLGPVPNEDGPRPDICR